MNLWLQFCKSWLMGWYTLLDQIEPNRDLYDVYRNGQRKEDD